MNQVSKVAVYGTLKRGHRANDMLNSASLVGVGRTALTYRMTDVGFPMLERDSAGHPVVVEVYDDPNWDRLDSYEGVPSLYERHVVDIAMDDGSTEQAYIYEATDIHGCEVEASNGILNWS